MFYLFHCPKVYQICFDIFEKLLLYDRDVKLKIQIIGLLTTYFSTDAIKILEKAIETETSYIILQKLNNLFEKSKDKSYLSRKIFTRLSTVFMTIPEESRIIFEIEFYRNNILDHWYLAPDFFKNNGTDSLAELIKKKRSRYKPYYAIENGYIVGLDLSELGLTELPMSIKTIKKLKYLNLSNNNLKSIPDWIVNLSELKEINLSYNNLS